MKVTAVEARVEGRSTVEDRQLRNSCRQVCCVFVAQAASGCRWNETSAGDDQRQTEDDSRQQDTPEQHQRATDARAPRP